jgi:uncharacterized protein CbrC (UPF0167 family)
LDDPEAYMELPTFRYHPDPIGTGSIEVSDVVCVVCQQARGYVYTSHAYSRKEYSNCICPWCIADGSAHGKLDVEFFDDVGIGGYGQWDKVSQVVIDEIVFRTPGFSGWQQERWFTHCEDAAAFLGRMGSEELRAYGEAIEVIRNYIGLNHKDERYELFEMLRKDGSPCAYLFRCLHCGTYGGYIDFD